MSSSIWTYTPSQEIRLYRQLASVNNLIFEKKRSPSLVSDALQAVISNDDIVVVPRVTVTRTGKIFHVTGKARSAKEAIDALDCPVKWGLTQTPEKIPMIIQPVDCQVRVIPLRQIRTTEEIYNLYPKILTPAEFFGFGAKFTEEQRQAPLLTIWLDANGQFWYAVLDVVGARRGVGVRQSHPDVEWGESYCVPVRE